MAIGAIGSDFNTFEASRPQPPSAQDLVRGGGFDLTPIPASLASTGLAGGGGGECCCECQSGQDSAGLSEEAMMMLAERQPGR